MEDLYKPVLFAYGDNDTTIFNKKGAMINATQMARPFGKRPADWLHLSSTKKFFNELSKIKNLSVADLVRSVKGSFADNREQGTWLHENVAFEFARWLSPAFAIWCNDQLRELNAAGNNPLMNDIELLQDSVYEQARKMDYHDSVLQSRTLIPANVIAKELGMSAIALNKLLHDKKIIYKSDEHWVLYAEYAGKGYTGTKTAIFRDSQGNYQSNIHTYWTERGREFIHDLINDLKQVA